MTSQKSNDKSALTEFNQSVFSIVGDDILEVLSDSNSDRTVVGFWDRLGFDVWLEASFIKIVYKGLKVVDPKEMTQINSDKKLALSFNLREFVFHDEFLVAGITGQDQRLVADIVVAVLVELVLEIILCADGEVDLSFPLLSDLQDTVSPVVGSLGVLLVVDRVVSNDEWVQEVGDRVANTMSNKTMTKNRMMTRIKS